MAGTMHNPAPMSGPPTIPAIECRNLTYSYRRAVVAADRPRPALENVTLTVAQRERLGVLGPNGGGKSTLLKLALGVLRGYTGEIRVMGMTPDEARRAGIIGYVPQRIEAELGFPVSVRQVVSMSAARGVPPWKPLPRARRENVSRVLDLVGIMPLGERSIGALSGGQLQRVMIARALAGEPKILFLDEPTVGVDVAGQQRFADLLRTLHATLDLTVVTVSHDLRTIAAGSDRVACLSRTLHFHDAPSGLTPRVLAEVFSHDVAGVFGNLHVDAHAASACTDPSHTHDHGTHSRPHP